MGKNKRKKENMELNFKVSLLVLNIKEQVCALVLTQAKKTTVVYDLFELLDLFMLMRYSAWVHWIIVNSTSKTIDRNIQKGWEMKKVSNFTIQRAINQSETSELCFKVTLLKVYEQFRMIVSLFSWQWGMGSHFLCHFGFAYNILYWKAGKVNIWLSMIVYSCSIFTYRTCVWQCLDPGRLIRLIHMMLVQMRRFQGSEYRC